MKEAGVIGIEDLLRRKEKAILKKKDAKAPPTEDEKIKISSLSEGLLPLSVQVNINYTVIHDFSLGYNGTGGSLDEDGRFDRFPYGISDFGSVANPTTSDNTEDPINGFSTERQFVLEEMKMKEAKNRSFKSPGSKRVRTFLDVAYDQATEATSGAFGDLHDKSPPDY
jgi:hypothetical protein